MLQARGEGHSEPLVASDPVPGSPERVARAMSASELAPGGGRSQSGGKAFVQRLRRGALRHRVFAAPDVLLLDRILDVLYGARLAQELPHSVFELF